MQREPMVGDIVKITVEDFCFEENTRAKLLRVDADGDWWADFDNMDNHPDSFDFRPDEPTAVWCIGTEFDFA